MKRGNSTVIVDRILVSAAETTQHHSENRSGPAVTPLKNTGGFRAELIRSSHLLGLRVGPANKLRNRASGNVMC